jgi:hypothetical protein
MNQENNQIPLADIFEDRIKIANIFGLEGIHAIDAACRVIHQEFGIDLKAKFDIDKIREEERKAIQEYREMLNGVEPKKKSKKKSKKTEDIFD